MKIAFCLITCNSDTFLLSWLNHYYKIADYILISEGATQSWMSALGYKSASSVDKTIEILKNFPDPDQKIRIHFAKRPYRDKCEQQNAYMALCPRDVDYVWIADTDEFYHYNDIEFMKDSLNIYEFDQVDVKMYHFFKNFNTIARGGDGWAYETKIPRIFKYFPYAMFKSHRPIKLIENPVKVETNDVKCYHYSYISRKEVYEKMLYYTREFKRDYINNWFLPVWEKWTEQNAKEIESKYSVHPSCAGAYTEQFEGIHPIDINQININL